MRQVIYFLTFFFLGGFTGSVFLDTPEILIVKSKVFLIMMWIIAILRILDDYSIFSNKKNK